MNALLFPGQGSQVVGMGAEFFSKFEIVKKIFRQADSKLNYPISKLILAVSPGFKTRSPSESSSRLKELTEREGY